MVNHNMIFSMQFKKELVERNKFLLRQLVSSVNVCVLLLGFEL